MSRRYAAAKRIVANHQHEEVEGYLVDAITASAMVAVYEAMNPDNQSKFDSVAPLPKLAAFCLKRVTL